MLADVADRDARRPVPVGQAREAMAAQDVADRRARDPGDGRQPMRSRSSWAWRVTRMASTVSWGRRPGRAVRPAGAPVLEAWLDLGLPVAAHPLRGRLAADAAAMRRRGPWPSPRPRCDRPAAADRSTVSFALRCAMRASRVGVSWIPTPNARGALACQQRIRKSHLGHGPQPRPLDCQARPRRRGS